MPKGIKIIKIKLVFTRYQRDKNNKIKLYLQGTKGAKNNKIKLHLQGTNGNENNKKPVFTRTGLTCE